MHVVFFRCLFLVRNIMVLARCLFLVLVLVLGAHALSEGNLISRGQRETLFRLVE